MSSPLPETDNRATPVPSDQGNAGNGDDDEGGGGCAVARLHAGIGGASPLGAGEHEPVVITSQDALEEALPGLLAAPMLGLDTETTGLDPRSSRLRLVQLATSERVYIIDCFEVAPRILGRVFTAARRFVGHNLKFDLGFLATAGSPVPSGERLFDTMLAAQLLGAGTDDGQLGRCSLAAVVERELGIVLDKTHQTSDLVRPALGCAACLRRPRRGGPAGPGRTARCSAGRRRTRPRRPDRDGRLTGHGEAGADRGSIRHRAVVGPCRLGAGARTRTRGRDHKAPRSTDQLELASAGEAGACRVGDRT